MVFKKKLKPYECPYELNPCPYYDIDTSLINKDCKICYNYNNGVRCSNCKIFKVLE